MRTIYMDGVFDLFHVGHLEAINQCKLLGDRVIIGVVGDKDTGHYKRSPIICETQRAEIVRSIKGVDQVVCPCPLVVDRDFITTHDITLVVHGFSNPEDEAKQQLFFQTPKELGIFQAIPYSTKINTTAILKRLKDLA